MEFDRRSLMAGGAQRKAFRHTHLKPGEAATIRIELATADLDFIGPDGRPAVEPGAFRFWIAASSADPALQGMSIFEA